MPELGDYTNEEIDEFLSDMQAQFDSMLAELREEVSRLKAEIEALSIYRK